MNPILEIPENGSTYISDVYIDPLGWLQAVGTEFEVDLESVDDDDLWPQFREVGEAILESLRVTDPDGVFFEGGNDELKASWTENTYNQENDFSGHFAFTVWTLPQHTEWFFEETVIAVRIGWGDPRGHYGPLRFFRVDSPADAGFTDWCVGWFVTVDGEQVSQSDRCTIGYSQNPTCETMRVFAELMREHGNEDITDLDICCGPEQCGTWVDGVYVVELADGSVIEAVPYINAY